MTDPLPSWNDGGPKQAIISFIAETTTRGSAKFVAPEEVSRRSIRTAQPGSSNRHTCRQGHPNETIETALGQRQGRQTGGDLPSHGSSAGHGFRQRRWRST